MQYQETTISRLYRSYRCGILFVLLAWVGLAGSTAAQQETQLPIAMLQSGILRAEDTLWEISTRHLPGCYAPRGDANFRVSQLVGCRWSPASLESVLAEEVEPGTRTIIYVHGNWMPLCDARQRAIRVYQATACRANGPLRFIAFSWPSEKQDHIVRDVAAKKPLIAANSFYLAEFVNRLPSGQPSGMLSYSFGSAIACGALHLLAGGALNGQVMNEELRTPHLMRLSLTAPAFDRAELQPSGQYHRALEHVDQLVNLYNSQDPILRRFRFFDRSKEPVAAGFAGLLVSRATSPLDANAKVTQYDCRAVGRSHWELEYFRCSAFSRYIDNALGQ